MEAKFVTSIQEQRSINPETRHYPCDDLPSNFLFYAEWSFPLIEERTWKKLENGATLTFTLEFPAIAQSCESTICYCIPHNVEQEVTPSRQERTRLHKACNWSYKTED